MINNSINDTVIYLSPKKPLLFSLLCVAIIQFASIPFN
jgi:hypothetical protein